MAGHGPPVNRKNEDMKTYNIALIPGDGTGPEVVREGVKVLEAAGSKFGFKYAFTNFDLVRLSATIFEWNKASARVLEKNGFKLEGRLIRSITKNRNTVDSLLYAITR